MTEPSDMIAHGKDVIEAEQLGLSALAHSLDKTFAAAVQSILNAKGHVVVVGLGKSGHIGRKLAASFASTGTPSFFLHPTEAAHGDLGMLMPGSVVLALSNSGESSEVLTVVDYARQNGLTALSISGSARSSLATESDIALILPKAEEACPNRLAPTTSTTMTLALGDALCVAAMRARGFSSDDFGRRHPAGKLGFGLQTVAEYIAKSSPDVPQVAPSAAMSDVIVAITRGDKGCVAVVDETRLVGIITDGDLRRAMSPDIMSRMAQDIMTPDPFTLPMTMRIKDAMSALSERKIGNAFVVEDSVILGLIDLKSLLAQAYA